MIIESKILQYENRLLKKERGIRLANVAILVGFLWYLVPYLYLTAIEGKNDSSFFNPIGIFAFFMIGRSQDLHLKHIASIKVYRIKMKDSPNKKVDRITNRA